MKKEPSYPMQPVIQDETGTLIFRPNAIVCALLDRNGGNLEGDFSLEDRAQFAQLIGSSVDDPRFDAIRPELPKPVRLKKKGYQPQPMQPVVKSARGVLRFRQNAIVDALVERDSERGRVYPDFPARTDGGLNWIGMQRFSQADQEQLAQLIGYSISGYHELSYVSDESAAKASMLAKALMPDAGGCRDDGCFHGGPLFDDDGKRLA